MPPPPAPIADAVVFVDAAFPRHLLRRDESSAVDSAVEWKRVGDIYGGARGFGDPQSVLLPDDLGAGDIAQGVHPDCFFITSVIAIVNARPDIIRSLFVTKDVQAEGKYTFRFFRWRAWEEVTIDDFVPVVTSGKDYRPLFARSPNGRMWPLLLEKAYAKFYSSFACIEGGNLPECMHDMAAAPVLQFGQQDGATSLTDAAFWAKWKRELDAKRVAMTAGTFGDGKKPQVLKQGLQEGHAFALLGIFLGIPGAGAGAKGSGGILLKLRNPTRGSAMQYKGPFGRSDAKAWRPDGEVRAVVEYSDDERADDSIFFITVAAFRELFNSLHICCLAEAMVRGGDSVEEGSSTRLAFEAESEWTAATAGGNSTLTSFRTNPSFIVDNSSSSEAAELLLVLEQPDQRRELLQRPSKEFDYLAIGVTAVVAGSDAAATKTTLLTMNNHRIAQKPTFRTQRDVTSTITVPAWSWCYLVPSTFNRGEKAPFLLRAFRANAASGSKVPSVRVSSFASSVDFEQPLVMSVELPGSGSSASVAFATKAASELHVLLRQDGDLKVSGVKSLLHQPKAQAKDASHGNTLADDYCSFSVTNDEDGSEVCGVPLAINYRELGAVSVRPVGPGSFSVVVKCAKQKTATGPIAVSVSVFAAKEAEPVQIFDKKPPPASVAPKPPVTSGKKASKAPAAVASVKAAPPASSGSTSKPSLARTHFPPFQREAGGGKASIANARAGLGDVMSEYANL